MESGKYRSRVQAGLKKRLDKSIPARNSESQNSRRVRRSCAIYEPGLHGARIEQPDERDERARKARTKLDFRESSREFKRAPPTAYEAPLSRPFLAIFFLLNRPVRVASKRGFVPSKWRARSADVGVISPHTRAIPRRISGGTTGESLRGSMVVQRHFIRLGLSVNFCE